MIKVSRILVAADLKPVSMRPSIQMPIGMPRPSDKRITPKQSDSFTLELPIRGALQDLPGTMKYVGNGYDATISIMGHTIQGWGQRMVDAKQDLYARAKAYLDKLSEEEAQNEAPLGFGELPKYAMIKKLNNFIDTK